MFFRRIIDGQESVGKSGVGNNYKRIMPFENVMHQALHFPTDVTANISVGIVNVILWCILQLQFS